MAGAISAADVKSLREATGAAMLDCKKALEQNDGDLAKAENWLKEKGLSAVNKKADRVAKDGRVEVYIHVGNRVAVMAEINCETDFVAKTDAFQEFAHNVAIHIAMANPKYVDATGISAADLEPLKEEFRKQALAEGKAAHGVDKIVEGSFSKYYQEACLLEQPFIKNEDVTIGQMLKEAIAAIGENIVIRRFIRYELGETN